MRRGSWAGRGLGCALALLVLLTGCGGPDYADLPLPGAGVSGDTYELTAVFDEALNLAQGAPVKVNGVPVGRVRSVTAQDFKARVVMEVRSSTELRRGSEARLRYDTPLGELFIQITPARRGGLLRDGDALPERSTSTAPTVEDTLSSASLLVNGGGLEQLGTITRELNGALGGREDTVRRTLRRTNDFLAAAQQSTEDIDRALRALAGASKALDARKGTIDRALRETVPVARVLRRSTDDVVALLRAVDTLSVTAQRVVGRTRQDILLVLEELGPIVDEVLATRPQLEPGLRNLIGAAAMFEQSIPGDWLPLHALIIAEQTEVPGPGGDGGGTPGDGGPDSPLPGLDLGAGPGGLTFSSMVGGGGAR